MVFFSVHINNNKKIIMQELKDVPDDFLELRWEQVTSKRSVQDTINNKSFANGVQDFEFGVSGLNAWIPAYSYFRYEFELYNVDSAGLKTLGVNPNTGIALANNAVGNMYNNVYCRAGGQDISSLTQYMPQASTLKCRINNSGSWLREVAGDAYLCEADFHKRANRLIKGNVSKTPTRLIVARARGDDTDTVEYNVATGNVTRVDGAGAVHSSFLTMGVKSGDTLVITLGGVEKSFRVGEAVTNSC
jgi:hypothetical protein